MTDQAVHPVPHHVAAAELDMQAVASFLRVSSAVACPKHGYVQFNMPPTLAREIARRIDLADHAPAPKIKLVQVESGPMSGATQGLMVFMLGLTLFGAAGDAVLAVLRAAAWLP